MIGAARLAPLIYMHEYASLSEGLIVLQSYVSTQMLKKYILVTKMAC